MADYLILFVACLFFSLQFVFQKLFEARAAGTFSVCLWNQLVCCAAGAVLLIWRSGFVPEALTLPGVLWAFGYSVSGILCSAATLFAMGSGPVAAVGTFCLAGGMILPFLWGILVLGESAGIFKWLGMAVLCLSLLPAALPASREKKESGGRGTLRFVFCCTVVFLTNGLVSIFSKMHQISPRAMSENGFLLLSAGMRFTAALVLLLLFAARIRIRGEREAIKKTFWDIGRQPMTALLFFGLIAFSVLYSVSNTLGNLFSLRCMVTMDASVQFPLLSAAVIVLTAFLGALCFRERITRSGWLSLALSVAGIAVFMLGA